MSSKGSILNFCGSVLAAIFVLWMSALNFLHYSVYWMKISIPSVYFHSFALPSFQPQAS